MQNSEKIDIRVAEDTEHIQRALVSLGEHIFTISELVDELRTRLDPALAVTEAKEMEEKDVASMPSKIEGHIEEMRVDCSNIVRKMNSILEHLRL